MGEHVRHGSLDANFEFESPHEQPATRFTAYDIGTPNRKPIEIGGQDGQNVTGLVVTGSHGQAKPLQVWRSSGRKMPAIGSDGSLVLRDVKLRLETKRGGLVLVATAANGRRYRLRLEPVKG